MGTVVALPRRPGRRLTGDRACFGLLPKGRGYRTRYLYACGFSDGVTKIGMTCKPRERAVEHFRGKHRSLLWFHLFGTTFDQFAAALVEREAVGIAAGLGSRVERTNEEFRELTRDQALACVRVAMRTAKQLPEAA